MSPRRGAGGGPERDRERGHPAGDGHERNGDRGHPTGGGTERGGGRGRPPDGGRERGGDRGHAPGGAMIVYGRNAVHEALRGPRTVSHVWATAAAVKGEPWLTGAGVPVTTVGGEEVERRAGSDGHQGVCAEVSAFHYAREEDLLSLESPLLMALDQVQDPQNLGAICRSAECAGASGVILPERRAAEVTPAVCKASAGAVEHLPLAQVRNLTDFLLAAKQHGMWCYGADGEASLGYREVDFTGPVVLVMGSEGRGLRPRVASACDALISLPLRGRIESLSVGAAAAVLLYAAAAARC